MNLVSSLGQRQMFIDTIFFESRRNFEVEITF